MPRPVLAFPCGSRSMMRTRSPIAAKAVARLIAVVVLPTPPFWLATVMMRGADFILSYARAVAVQIVSTRSGAPKIANLQYHAVRVDDASVFYQIERPVLNAFF